MKLHELARGVPGATIEGNGDVEINGIAYDSRRVKPGDLFVAVEGLQVDGRAYVADPLKAGAEAIPSEPAWTAPGRTAPRRRASARGTPPEPAPQVHRRAPRRI